MQSTVRHFISSTTQTHLLSFNVRRNHSRPNSPLSGSAKLFADAEREEAELNESGSAPQKFTKLSVLAQQHENWNGDERMEDTVLRMLLDKYKPIRTGSIQSADEKMKRAPPSLSTRPTLRLSPGFDQGATRQSATVTASVPQMSSVPLKPLSGSWASESLLPSTEGHQPWHTTFKAPSHAVSSIKHARLPPSPPFISSKNSLVASGVDPLDERARRLEKEKRKKAHHAGRLTQAKDSTLDYRLGIRSPRSGHAAAMHRPNPVSLKGWTNLVEERIQRARQAGLFNSVKGRGKPLERTAEEHNPFIGREEFLMNRILKRNEAAPPWVEVQAELETAVRTFREILHTSWTRRTLRMLSIDHPHPSLLSALTFPSIRAHRDAEWLAREAAFHDAGIKDLNGLVRKYNAMAPYAVRRPFYEREVELRKMYEECAEEIWEGVRERRGGGPGVGSRAQGFIGDDRGEGSSKQAIPAGDGFYFGRWLRTVVGRLFGTDP